jgi:hypothetical protein
MMGMCWSGLFLEFDILIAFNFLIPFILLKITSFTLYIHFRFKDVSFTYCWSVFMYSARNVIYIIVELTLV